MSRFPVRQPHNRKDVSERAIGVHDRVIVIEDGFVTIATALGELVAAESAGKREFWEWS